jgi:undecaprenyl diphosphate synthase
MVNYSLAQLPERLLQAINDVQRATENCKGLNINLCLSYGGRHEIVSACQQVAQAVADGTLNPAAIG